MYWNIKDFLQTELNWIKEAWLYKQERVIVSPQEAEIKLENGKTVLNFCANNYLWLSNHPELKKAVQETLETHWYGMSSVRFICGTTDIHKTLENKISEFFGTEDTLLYAACFDANGWIFEPLLWPDDAIISDSLNHASIIDGVRLSKAQRYRYENANIQDLEAKLIEAKDARFKLIVTDGVFSMDGNVAPLDKIVELANKYDAMVMVDECHSAGVVWKTGRGVTEHFDIRWKVEIITGTLWKAFGGAIGWFTTWKKEIIEFLRQRSRPYLFSNSIPPIVAAAWIKVFDMMSSTSDLQDKLHANTTYFMERMKGLGFDLKPTASAICALMLYDAKLSQDFAKELLEEWIYVIGFYYPVVAQWQARIRIQLSAAHEIAHLDKAIAAFEKVGKKLGVI